MDRSRAWAIRIAALVSFAAAPAWAGTQVLAPSDDTFINSVNPDNNNGAAGSVFTGTDGHGGLMRGLIRFAMPAGLQGRATVTGVQLRLIVRQFTDNTVGAGTPAVETLARPTQSWAQGNGVNDVTGNFTVGVLCGGTITGATWNQTDCATAISWTSPGGTVVGSPSGQVDTTGVAVNAPVVWDSASNPTMNADVQSWIDTPTSNNGWRIASSTEGQRAEAQRFYSMEAGMFAPSLSITFACKPGFVEGGGVCVAAPPSVPALPLWALAILGAGLGLGATLVIGRRRRAKNAPAA
jgi:hypothetical protein